MILGAILKICLPSFLTSGSFSDDPSENFTVHSSHQASCGKSARVYLIILSTRTRQPNSR